MTTYRLHMKELLTKDRQRLGRTCWSALHADFVPTPFEAKRAFFLLCFWKHHMEALSEAYNKSQFANVQLHADVHTSTIYHGQT